MKTKIEKNKAYPLLTADEKGNVKCPFCGEYHKHGSAGGDGHRVPDCKTLIIFNPVFHNGHWFRKKDGYFVEFPKSKKQKTLQ